jgi:homoserine kinase type II
MAVKTHFSAQDFRAILSQYSLGTYLSSAPIAAGTIQTNYFLETTQGKYVFRCYENRTADSARFECLVLAYLKKRHYPSPYPLKNRRGSYVGEAQQKPYVLFPFLEGRPLDHPTEHDKRQLIQKAAELQAITRGYRPRYHEARWNYTPQLCCHLAREQAEKLGTPAAAEKLAWLEQQLDLLQLPHALPKGICHCDFDFSNVFFQGAEFAALLDFDDANYTYLLFDLVGMIETWAWTYPAKTLDLAQARSVAAEYACYRPLNRLEQRHLFDVLKLGILIDCVWYFARGGAEDFYEKRKVDFLNQLGREAFYQALFQK